MKIKGLNCFETELIGNFMISLNGVTNWRIASVKNFHRFIWVEMWNTCN
jgi:hypothetical protein